MSGISTHVLDTAAGRPADGIPVTLFAAERQVGSGSTNQDGRCSTLLYEDTKLETTTYRIVFDIAARFPNSFYPIVTISFRVADSSAHYHIPLLLSPFGYTTYRGT